MSWYAHVRIPTPTPARSLVWRGDELVDWLSAGRAWRIGDGGRAIGGPTNAFDSTVGGGAGAEALDAVIADDTGRWAVAHRRAGTRGVLLHDGVVVRELARAAYQAQAYDWPACFARVDGRTLLLHCPEVYARVEIDDVVSGERVSKSSDPRRDVDFFYSHLSVSPRAKRIATAGWVWQPWNVVRWRELLPAVEDPTLLDEWQGAAHSAHVGLAEESSATWLGDELLLIGASAEPEDAETIAELEEEAHALEHGAELRLRTSGVAVIDAATGVCVRSVELGYPAGAMMAAGFHHVVTFFRHPRLVALDTGEVVHEWPTLDTGDIASCITWGRARPPLAIDAANARFAVQGTDAIDVVTLDLAGLPSMRPPTRLP